MSNLNFNKINPAVKQMIEPIIVKMTEIDHAQHMNPTMGILAYNEPAVYKELKKQCVHITYDRTTNEYKLRAGRDPITGECKCDVCGRPIYSKFDKSAIDKIMGCLDVVNQLLIYGMLYDLTPDVIEKLIDLKVNLPILAKIMQGLNDVIKMDNASNESMGNLGAIYTPNNNGGLFNSFTSTR